MVKKKISRRFWTAWDSEAPTFNVKERNYPHHDSSLDIEPACPWSRRGWSTTEKKEATVSVAYPQTTLFAEVLSHLFSVMALRHWRLARITQAQVESSIKAETKRMLRVSLSKSSYNPHLSVPDGFLASSFTIWCPYIGEMPTHTWSPKKPRVQRTGGQVVSFQWKKSSWDSADQCTLPKYCRRFFGSS